MNSETMRVGVLAALALVVPLMRAGAVEGVLGAERFRAYADGFAAGDRETVVNAIPNAAAWEWMAANVPRFECPDKKLEEVYWFRWWTFRKHLKETVDGWIVTEFLPAVPWAGKHNSINCPAGHHFREGRWIHDRKVLDDYAVFWFRKGGEPRKYSFWAADSMEARARVIGDDAVVRDLLPELKANWEAWAGDHRDESGLYWQNDGNDGMEVSVGGSGCRATLNSYQYGDAVAIAAVLERAGKREEAEEWRGKAAALRELVEKRLWDAEAEFFKVRPRGGGELAGVRELHGYVPWCFHLPGPDKSGAWRQLMDPKGFKAPFGPTTAEQRHAGFRVAYEGHECQWNGPSWPFATSQTLTAMANLLHDYRQEVVSRKDYWEVLQGYVRSHRFRQLPPERGEGGLTKSADTSVARHTWWAEGRLGNAEWVQYDFPAEVTADAVEVYWYDDAQGIDAPMGWRVMVKDGGGWKEVTVRGVRGTALDRFNRVEIEPVRTGALRLEVQSAPGKSAGLLEWRVLAGRENAAVGAVASASYTDVYGGRLDALNDGAGGLERVESERPWIDENLNPYTGDWMARTLLKQRRQAPDERGKDYNHSTFCDLVISGLVGLRARADDVLEVSPLLPEGEWDWFCLDHVPYHGRVVTVIWDRDGKRYGRGAGLQVLVDGERAGGAERLETVRVMMPRGGR
jgi:hypothetical protein